MKITYPEMRGDLARAARCLADVEFQDAYWAQRVRVPPDRFGFDDAVSTVVDEFTIDGPPPLVGAVLHDWVELARYVELSTALHVMINRVGPRGTYADAAPTAEFTRVREAAEELCSAMSANDA
jgi:hypothetical protein